MKPALASSWSAVLQRLGAPANSVTSRIAPNAATSAEPLPSPLWLEWLALAGLLLFATWLLGARGVWALLLTADPTGITVVILVVFASATLWCGGRARTLQAQRQALESSQPGWATSYLVALQNQPRDSAVPLDLLLEHTHGPHHTAWWANAIQLKLGLLGKVIGFSMLALQIGQLQNFDPAQSQELLKSLTGGLGVALLTTMVGLVGNIVLGLQLTRLDRYADRLVADVQRAGLALPAQKIAPEAAA